MGDDLGIPGEQLILPGGLLNPAGAHVHNIVKYHGPASNDPVSLDGQLTTILGSCALGANAVDLGIPFGIQCFDPQVAVHLP